ncbi:hypothetical protein D3C87_2126230 [compost metagenome]
MHEQHRLDVLYRIDGAAAKLGQQLGAHVGRPDRLIVRERADTEFSSGSAGQQFPVGRQPLNIVDLAARQAHADG